MIRVLLVDDQTLVRHGLRELLHLMPDLQLVGEAADGLEAMALLELFALEKSCYELRYELDNRPDWVAIPLEGLCELLLPEAKDAPR